MGQPSLTKFPFIALGKALERARALYQSDPGNKGMSIPMAFAAWDYSEKSSGGFQTVSALKQYGLVEDEGSNEDRRVKLTDEARNYFASEIAKDRETLSHDFALSPPSLRHLADQWNYSCPPDNVARTYLKTDLGMNEQSARSLLGIYKDNQKYISDKLNNQSSDVAEEPAESGPPESEPSASQSIKSYTTNDVRPENTDRDIFSVHEGEVTLISPKKLTSESLEDISDWLDIMKRKLSRKVVSIDELL